MGRPLENNFPEMPVIISWKLWFWWW